MSGGKRAAEVVGLLVPHAAGIATAIALWGEPAPRIFFAAAAAAAAEVIALGALAMGSGAVAIQALFGFDEAEPAG